MPLAVPGGRPVPTWRNLAAEAYPGVNYTGPTGPNYFECILPLPSPDQFVRTGLAHLEQERSQTIHVVYQGHINNTSPAVTYAGFLWAELVFTPIPYTASVVNEGASVPQPGLPSTWVGDIVNYVSTGLTVDGANVPVWLHNSFGPLSTVLDVEDKSRGDLVAICAVQLIHGSNANPDLSIYHRLLWGPTQ